MTKFTSGWRTEHTDWLVLVGLIGIIYGTLPYGPNIIESLYSCIGKDEFNSIVLFIGLFGIIVSLVYSLSLSGFSKGHIGRIALAAGILAYMAQFITIPAERLHFVEYGLLGMAIERVLRPHIRDMGRPFVGMLSVYFFGMGDEIIQWLLSNRHGEIIDVFLNGWGGALGILLLPWPQQTLTSSSHRLIFLLITVAIMVSVWRWNSLRLDIARLARRETRLISALDEDYAHGEKAHYYGFDWHEYFKRGGEVRVISTSINP